MNTAKKKNIRTILIGAAVLTAPLLFFLLVPPFGQDPSYHRFADTRHFLQTPNFLNVLSNTAFVAVGCYGLVLLVARNSYTTIPPGSRITALFFLGLTLTGFGSGYYHLAPDNATLTWDRLPMTIAFTALTVAVLSEHVRRGLSGGFSIRCLPLDSSVSGTGSIPNNSATEISGCTSSFSFCR